MCIRQLKHVRHFLSLCMRRCVKRHLFSKSDRKLHWKEYKRWSIVVSRELLFIEGCSHLFVKAGHQYLKKKFSGTEIRLIGGRRSQSPMSYFWSLSIIVESFCYFQAIVTFEMLSTTGFSLSLNKTASIMLALWRVNLSISTNIGFSKFTRFPFKRGLTKRIIDFLFWESLTFLNDPLFICYPFRREFLMIPRCRPYWKPRCQVSSKGKPSLGHKVLLHSLRCCY